jgi:hypothetical protein
MKYHAPVRQVVFQVLFQGRERMRGFTWLVVVGVAMWLFGSDVTGA